MLVLSRKPGEVIVIGKNIRLTVVEIRGKQVRLGFKAPPEVSILRKELGEEAEDLETRRCSAQLRAKWKSRNTDYV